MRPPNFLRDETLPGFGVVAGLYSQCTLTRGTIIKSRLTNHGIRIFGLQPAAHTGTKGCPFIPLHAPAATLLRSTPMPVISISTVSPGLMFCGIPSVPIHITSPGSIVQYFDTSAM
jgi:hypothetical protein